MARMPSPAKFLAGAEPQLLDFFGEGPFGHLFCPIPLPPFPSRTALRNSYRLQHDLVRGPVPTFRDHALVCRACGCSSASSAASPPAPEYSASSMSSNIVSRSLVHGGPGTVELGAALVGQDRPSRTRQITSAPDSRRLTSPCASSASSVRAQRRLLGDRVEQRGRSTVTPSRDRQDGERARLARWCVPRKAVSASRKVGVVARR
jgi:hypothetical protein